MANQNGTYTYDDFQKKYSASPYAGQFSDYDLQTAKSNPDFGMSMLSLKDQYANAPTAEAKAKINDQANELRRSYGGYSAGTDGSHFTLEPLSPQQFRYDAAPTYANRYDEKTQNLLNTILNREQFSYNPDTDPLYAQYQKAYTREGRRASADTMAQAASMTGGLPSSYAASAAAQAGNYYAAQMTDKIPELQKLAYDQYLQEDQLKRSDLNALMGLEQVDYDKYKNNLAQYNQDRNFAYQNLIDEVNNQSYRTQQAQQFAQLAGEYGDFSHLNKLGVNTDRNLYDINRQMNLDANARANRESNANVAATLAGTALSAGDPQKLKEAGYNTDPNWLYRMAMANSGKLV